MTLGTVCDKWWENIFNQSFYQSVTLYIYVLENHYDKMV